MTNNMKHEIMKRRRSLKHQAKEEKSENEILNSIFDTFDKLKDDAIFKLVVQELNKTIENATSHEAVTTIYEYNLQQSIEDEILDVLGEYGDEIIADVCNKLGVEVDESYYDKLYDHAFVRYIGKVI